VRRASFYFETATALVTGAGNGIGRATAHALADKGATVLCTDIDQAAAEQTATECRARARSGGRGGHRAYRLDVADRGAVDTLAAAVHEDHGALTILVNNAGVGMTGAYSHMSAEEWAFIRSINLDGVVNCCSAFAPPMLFARHGQVVNVSSGLAFLPTAGESAYAATKAAVLQLSQCLRAAWASQGVGVTAICPGFVNTSIASSVRFTGNQEDPKTRERLIKGFSRAHPPEKVGLAIVNAIATNRALVPVGFESVLGWYAHRLAPIAFQQFLARLGARSPK
jgi:2-hydroxycyclohexanecarboxyl-CoA dehydrogenase